MDRPPALVVAACHGLQPPLATLELDQVDASQALALAQHDHLTGFLAAAVQAGTVIVDDASAEQIVTAWHDELLACVVLEALTVRTAGTLDAASVRWRLTKGAALAHLDYADPALRTFGDVDIIVHPDDWHEAVNALTSAGMQREIATLGGDYDRRYGKGATLATADGFEIDLHRRLAIGRFGVTSRMEDLFDAPAEITLAGRAIPVLTPEQRLLHACYHASLGGFRRLRAFRDVAQLILHTQADWQATFAVARRWRAEAVVTSAIIETWHLLGLEGGHPALEAARRLPITRADRRALTVFHEERPFRAQALTAVGRLRPVQIPPYLWALVSQRLAGRRHPADGTEG